jgi:hypothetical protein
MTTNGTGREGKRGDEYRRETEEGAHICQEVLESVVCDIMDGGSPVHGGGLNVLGRSWSHHRDMVGGINRLRPCEVGPPSSSSSRCSIRRQARRDQRLRRFPAWGSWEDGRVCAWVGARHPPPQPFSVGVGK